MLPVILSAVAPILTDVIDRLFPDSDKREQARLEIMAKMQDSLNQLDLAQMEVNKQEATHASIFVAGWRPFIGWVCGLAFAYHYLVQPLLVFLLAAAGHAVAPPAFDMEAMMYVLGGMLGLGGLRTIEKAKGIGTAGLSGQLPWKRQP